MDDIVSKLPHAEKLCDSIFLFYQPKVPVQLEVVFIHGLEHCTCGDAYWKTWLARDDKPNNIWPMTWLPDEFPSAKVFALKYDANMKQTATNGRMDLFLVGEMLIQEMVMFGEIGQNGVPVVFVCHGFGGLVAKQIVISAKNCSSQDLEAQKLLKNIGAILFYSTPHRGSHLTKFSSYIDRIWGGGKGPLLENLEVLSTNISRLSQDFVQVANEHYWDFLSAVETHITERYGEMVVDEASSRFELGSHIALSVDHFDVVRPKTKKDSSYLLLTKCLKKVLVQYAPTLAYTVDNLVPNSFVELEEQEDTIKRKLQEVPIVGLVGMGGIGKTTLAKAVYQSICKDFDNSCYLDDIKSKANLDDVLIILLQSFGIKDRKTSCIVERSGLQDYKKSLLEDLKTYVQQHKVLVVMDDVGTKGNLDYLLKEMDFLNGDKESKVIITCRNWQVLKDDVQKSGIYEVGPMRCGQDTKLFAYHAFKGATTLEQRRNKLLQFLSKDSSENLIYEFESKYDAVVKACGGLPLSLEVMGCCLGSYLMDDDLSSKDCLDCSRGALEKLERAEPLEGGVDNDKLWPLLRISYDCLHENEKNMFLDIACFFCDSMQYGQQTLLRIWGGKPPKLIELNNLKERCLVKINEEDESVTMHDQLRDMGQGIVRQQCERILNRTRLWTFEDVSKLFQSNEITSPWIQGLSLDEWSKTLTTNMKSKSSGTTKGQKTSKQKGFCLDCPSLRLLNLHEMEENVIKAISIKDSSCIQWLCLKGIHISKLPKFVQDCKNLCVLDMRDCRYLKKLDESIANLVNLLELNLSNCLNLVSLSNSLGDMVKLTRLDLFNCQRLTSLPNSIGKLVNLYTLCINGCWRLTSLPDSIGNMVNLTRLSLSNCKGLTSLPDSIGNMVNFTSLNLYYCTRLTSLPDSIGNMVNLRNLDLSCCKGLTSLPDSIGNMVKLTSLDLSWCEGLTSLPDSIGNMVNLTSLNLKGCKGLTSLPDSIGNMVKLTSLDLSCCEGLTSLSDSIGNMVNLNSLNLYGCKGLTSLPDSIGNMVKLTSLNLTWCKGLTSLPDSIGNMVNLTSLNLYYCTRLTSLPDSIGNMVNLTSLKLYICEGLTSLPDSIGNMVKLTSLDLSWCQGLTSLPDSIGNMVNLTSLNFYICEGLTSLPNSIGNMVKLTSLKFRSCKGLTSLPDSIGNMVNLTSLDLRGCTRLTSLPDSIGNMVNLTSLNLYICEGLTSLPDSIGNMVNLTSLNLSSCNGLTSLPDSIGDIDKLTSLDLSCCEGLTSLSDSIGNMVNLTSLNLNGCKGLTSLPDSIGNMVKLTSLSLTWCKGLTSLPDSIGNMVNLTSLCLFQCEGLTNLPDSIGNMVKLTSLNLFGCEGLTSLPDSIGYMVKLTSLNLSCCKGLTNLPNSIGNMVNLRSLDLHGCKGLTSLPDSIGNMVKLTSLNLFGCEGLTSLPDSIGYMVKLTSLNLSCCKGLTSLPDSIGNMVNLTRLRLYGCNGLTSLPDSIGNMVNLTSLDLHGCKGLTNLPDSIGNMVNLRSLDLHGCKGLTSLPNSIGKLVKLSTLNIYGYKRLRSLPNFIGNVVNLSTCNF